MSPARLPDCSTRVAARSISRSAAASTFRAGGAVGRDVRRGGRWAPVRADLHDRGVRRTGSQALDGLACHG